jgi:hypothetical protein
MSHNEADLITIVLSEIKKLGCTLLLDPIGEKLVVRELTDTSGPATINGYHVWPASNKGKIHLRHDGAAPIAVTEHYANILLNGGKLYRIHYNSQQKEDALKILEEAAGKILPE